MMPKLKYVRRGFAIFFIVCVSHHCLAQAATTDTIRIYFEFDKHQPDLPQLQKLDTLLSLSKHSPEDILSISVVGFTDTAGTKSYNSQLADLRSNYVRNFIADKSVVREIAGYGFGELYIPGTSQDSCRKVEVILERRLDKKPSTDVRDVVKRDSIVNAIQLTVDTIMVMNDILFEPDKAILAQGSAYRLTRYLRVLSAYGHRSIEVRGHVNHTDSELDPSDPLFKLSVDRAKLVHDLLIDQGISSERLSFRGMGNSELLNDKPKNLQEKLLNMRVEIIIYK
jgi:outer membrane protein OmpA-like peptidoglycan-associated protein